METVKPAGGNTISHEEASTPKADEIQGLVKQDWVLKIGIFGFGFVFIMWLVSRKRRSAYEALKQDEKSTA